MLKLEIYNITDRTGTIANGYLVARYTEDGRRCNTVQKFDRDKQAALDFIALQP